RRVAANECIPASAVVNVYEVGENVPSGSVVVSVTVPVYPTAVLPNGAAAVTGKAWATPAGVGEGNPATRSCDGGAGVTMIPVSLPEATPEALASISHVPTLRRVAPLVNVLVPLSPARNVYVVGVTVPSGSVVDRLTVPVYPVA